MTRAIDQTLALFYDAYRELNSKRLFWISLIISGLVVVGFAGIGIRHEKLSLFGMPTPFPAFGSMAVLYKLGFSTLGVGFWLTFASMILALVSTAGIFPDLITGGTIDLYLSRPISRLRLFLTKYLTGLMFAGLQVTVFCVACWLVMGLRAGVWSPRLFIAVPLVICVFSYLFCVVVLLGLLTRSTIAAILLTSVFWCGLFFLDKAELIVLPFKLAAAQSLRDFDQHHRATTRPADLGTMAERAELAASANRLNIAHTFLYETKTALPKTHETNDLIDRAILTREEIRDLNNKDAEQSDSMSENSPNGQPGGLDRRVLRETAQIVNSRTAKWAVGTSLLFESVIVALAAWVFCRRDY